MLEKILYGGGTVAGLFFSTVTRSLSINEPSFDNFFFYSNLLSIIATGNLGIMCMYHNLDKYKEKPIKNLIGHTIKDYALFMLQLL